MAPCWQVGTWSLSPSLFPTHTSASKHFLFGWNLFCWFESSRNSSSIDADDGTKWSLASRRADCSTSSAIPRPRLSLINKAYSSHMGNRIGQSFARWNTLKFGPVSGAVSSSCDVRKAKRPTEFCCCSLPLDQWHLPDLRFRKTKSCHSNQSHESSSSRFVL